MNQFRFIDLFAGIGGFRIALEKQGGKCVFTSEWDKHSQKTYEDNFGEKPHGDIRKINAKNIPDHDILIGGFPCQPFSIAGVSKKISLGQKHGFQDVKQGNLFFEITRILAEKKPSSFLLENVKNLKSHDKGRTFNIIIKNLNELNYELFVKVIDAQHFVPQHRERIFLVGFRRDVYPGIDFQFPSPPKKQQRISYILEENVDEKYTLSDNLWKFLKEYAEKHRKLGNGFGFGLITPETDNITRTLSARYFKDGSEILIKQKGKNPRRLTPRECARLMGFSDKFKITVSDTQAYRQFGNAVVVSVAESIAKNMVQTMKDYTKNKHKPTQMCLIANNQSSNLMPAMCNWQ